MHRLRALAPWWVRLAVKIALAPIPYRVWQRTSLFRHGGMQRVSYVRGVFEKHHGFVGPLPSECVLLEIGPGDSIGSALLASAIGASQTYLVDVGLFASSDVRLYRTMARSLADAGYAVPDISHVENMPDLLAACRARYLTDGVKSLASIPAGSVDFAWSNAVMQSVHRDEMHGLANELRRILKPAGVSSHTIDFTDLLGGALNHLRVPATLWESRWVKGSGAYTNRLRCSEMLDLFREAGFSVEIITKKTWTELPTRREAMSARFRRMAADDLLTYHLDVVMRPQGDVYELARAQPRRSAPPGG